MLASTISGFLVVPSRDLVTARQAWAMPRAVQPTRARTHPAPRCGLGQRIAGAHAELASRQDVLRSFRAGRPRLLRRPGGRSPAGADGFPVSSPSLHDPQPDAAPFSGAGALAGSGVARTTAAGVGGCSGQSDLRR